MKKDCSSCPRMGRDCIKKLIVLPLNELLDWCRHIMVDYKITHEQLAQASNTPKGTIDRILAKQATDCKYSTIHAMVCALLEIIGIPTVCAEEAVAEAGTQADELKRQNAELQKALADSEKDRQALQVRLADFSETLTYTRAQIVKKDERIDALSKTVTGWRRTVKTLALLLGVSVLLIIAALVADKLNPNIGFIWRA